MDNVNFSGLFSTSPLLVLTLLAAGAAMAFGIGRGRPDLGGRAFVLVVLSSLGLTLLASWFTFRSLGFSSQMALWAAGNIVFSHLVGAVPLWIALRWIQDIQRATDDRGGR
ncbi:MULTISPECIES: hypothetical protein [Deinococcus]|uniref:hypothetical protein n=1 Tax=Deinococcus TaxID=1298 RepID=UPI0004867D6B|nr:MULTISPECIES: hypothetical protein [Deinococcus]KEF33304.1 hypothetical protein RDMS_13240 [Deinococcus sp. RL]